MGRNIDFAGKTISGSYVLYTGLYNLSVRNIGRSALISRMQVIYLNYNFFLSWSDCARYESVQSPHYENAKEKDNLSLLSIVNVGVKCHYTIQLSFSLSFARLEKIFSDATRKTIC